MCAAAKGIQPRTRTSVRMLEAPEARQIELFRQAQDERSHGLDVAAFIVANPQDAALWAVLQRQVKAIEPQLVDLETLRQMGCSASATAMTAGAGSADGTAKGGATGAR